MKQYEKSWILRIFHAIGALDGCRFLSIWSWPNVLDFLLVLLAVFEVWVPQGGASFRGPTGGRVMQDLDVHLFLRPLHGLYCFALHTLHQLTTWPTRGRASQAGRGKGVIERKPLETP